MPSLQRPKWNMAARAIPLAVVADVSTSPQTLYIHADHLDRPVRMSDGSKALVWDAVYRPFGAVETLTGSAVLDARFPGQWFQLETGLHYNWHRHYDPTTGRYLQPDPLGFVDGASVYAYAANAPATKVDSKGLNLQGPMTMRPKTNNLMCFSLRERDEDREEYCFNKCLHLLGIGHGNEYRGCYRRCMGEKLG